LRVESSSAPREARRLTVKIGNDAPDWEYGTGTQKELALPLPFEGILELNLEVDPIDYGGTRRQYEGPWAPIRLLEEAGGMQSSMGELVFAGMKRYKYKFRIQDSSRELLLAIKNFRMPNVVFH